MSHFLARQSPRFPALASPASPPQSIRLREGPSVAHRSCRFIDMIMSTSDVSRNEDTSNAVERRKMKIGCSSKCLDDYSRTTPGTYRERKGSDTGASRRDSRVIVPPSCLSSRERLQVIITLLFAHGGRTEVRRCPVPPPRVVRIELVRRRSLTTANCTQTVSPPRLGTDETKGDCQTAPDARCGQRRVVAPPRYIA